MHGLNGALRNPPSFYFSFPKGGGNRAWNGNFVSRKLANYRGPKKLIVIFLKHDVGRRNNFFEIVADISYLFSIVQK